MNGKGSKPRPLSVSKDDFQDNWNRIFKKKKENPLPFTDSKPNENMFDDLNLKNTRETGDNNE